MLVSVRTYDDKIIKIRPEFLALMEGLKREVNGNGISFFSLIRLQHLDPFQATKFFINNENIVNLASIHSTIMNLILEWHEAHRSCSMPNNNYGAKETWKLCKWDEEFFQKNDKIAVNIFQAAWDLEDRNIADAAAIYIRDRLKKDPRMNPVQLSKQITRM
nr:hypothetical protein HmN_000123900 [Hymenolepis microstoma]